MILFKSFHHYWLDSLRWLIELGKYTRKDFSDRSTDESQVSRGFLDRFTFAESGSLSISVSNWGNNLLSNSMPHVIEFILRKKLKWTKMKNFFPGKSFSYGRKFISKIPFKKKKIKRNLKFVIFCSNYRKGDRKWIYCIHILNEMNLNIEIFKEIIRFLNMKR